ncbi:alpha-hydroxy acid oxidase [Malikia sp.]|uniref:alpha-hydroxy acid oxidase n=1 Tax=Malikia sp. TaxID=2070706 RepID=UPI0026130B8F|nr:alpha-hydroxy acid oxidase [Malikia sp.]MDD2729057.1 alpha-hydroxy acid oxidase [Malikia sp.]
MSTTTHHDQPASLPTRLFNLADHEARARDRLDASAWAYYSGGAADEITLRANRAAWDALALRPRVLRPLAGLSLASQLLGQALPCPLLVAPMAHQRLAHPDGELATAVAAAAVGAGLVLSQQSSHPLEAVAAHCLADPERGPFWFQLHALGERGWLRELIARAEAAGVEALVLTVDAPLNGVRDRERRAGFALPAGLATPHLPPASASSLDGLLAQAPSWDDVAWLQANSRLPLLLKGVTHPLDAAQACALGVAGLIVSNHGGRVLDTMPASATLLPEVAAVVAGRCALLVDGGIRRGTDVLKALALGADAVLIGRPVLHGLASAGAAGVAHVLRLLQDELAAAMALCGLRNLSEIDPSCLQSPRDIRT